MSSVVIWFAALVTVIGSFNTVGSYPAQALDLTKVLRLAQRLRLDKPNKQGILRHSDYDDYSGSDYTSSEYYSDYSSDSDYYDTNRAKTKSKDTLLDLVYEIPNSKGKGEDIKLGRSGFVDKTHLAKARIIDLIETAAANEKKKNDRPTNRKRKLSHGRNEYLFRSKNYDSALGNNNNGQKQTLEKLLSQIVGEERQKKPKKRLKPNRLTPTLNMDDVKKYYGNKNKNDEVPGLENYSKVYIVLNPEAVKNSKNKNALNDLISKVLSLSSKTPKQEPQQVDPFRYKGFIVKRRFKDMGDNIGRMRDSEKKSNLPAAVPLERITAMPT